MPRRKGQKGTQRGIGRSERRLGCRLSPDTCPAARWMERKRRCLQSRSLRKPSEWPWVQGAQPLSLPPSWTRSLLRSGPEDVLFTLGPQHHPSQAQAQRRASVKGSREMNAPLLTCKPFYQPFPPPVKPSPALRLSLPPPSHLGSQGFFSGKPTLTCPLS